MRGVWISGWHANQILDAVEGATVPMVRKALLDAGPETGRRASPDVIIKIAKRLTLFAPHGSPEDRCGGPVGEFAWKHKLGHALSKHARSRWVCLSQACIDDAAESRLSRERLFEIFETLSGELKEDVEGGILPAAQYVTLQADFEAQFKAKAAEARKEIEARQSSNGIIRAEDEGGVKVFIEDAERVNRYIGINGEVTRHQLDLTEAFSAAWNDVKTRIVDWDNDVIWLRVERLIDLLKDRYHYTKAVKKAFPEAFRGEVAA